MLLDDKAVLDFIQSSANQVESLFGVAERGVDFYFDVKSRANDLTKKVTDRVDIEKAPVSTDNAFLKFVKSESGMVIIGALGVLGLGLILSRGN